MGRQFEFLSSGSTVDVESVGSRVESPRLGSNILVTVENRFNGIVTRNTISPTGYW